MSTVELDHRGRLTYLRNDPAQRQDAPTHAAAVDWAPLFALAGLDAAKLTPAEPLWNWLAGSDTRAAWTGSWPESGRPLRVEAAALGGRPVAFMRVGTVAKAMADAGAVARPRRALTVMLLFALAFCIIGGCRPGWRGRTCVTDAATRLARAGWRPA